MTWTEQPPSSVSEFTLRHYGLAGPPYLMYASVAGAVVLALGGGYAMTRMRRRRVGQGWTA